MSHQNNRNNPVPHNNQTNRFNKEDTYGIFKQELEVDSDVNEDPNRERLLDESVGYFLQSEEEE
jgi:hypothetical protein